MSTKTPSILLSKKKNVKGINKIIFTKPSRENQNKKFKRKNIRNILMIKIKVKNGANQFIFSSN